MDRWQDKVAVVTGASAGIGAAITENLVDSGLKVVGLARRKEKLDDLAQKLKGRCGEFYSKVADISKENDVVASFDWIKKNVGPIAILVNNAAVSRNAQLSDGKTHHWKDVFDTNVMGLCIATREAVQDMKANGIDGHIVHINSVAGHKLTAMTKSINAVSKYAVTALTETLRYELVAMKSKIKITSVSPGFVETEVIEATIKASGSKEYSMEELEIWKQAPMLKSKDIADAVNYVLSTPPHVQIHELMIQPVGEAF